MKGTVGIDVFITSRNVEPLVNVIRISTPSSTSCYHRIYFKKYLILSENSFQKVLEECKFIPNNA